MFSSISLKRKWLKLTKLQWRKCELRQWEKVSSFTYQVFVGLLPFLFSLRLRMASLVNKGIMTWQKEFTGLYRDMFATLLVSNLPINRGVCTVFIQLNAAAFTIFFVIRVRRLFEGGVYLKYTLFLATMVTNYFNFGEQKRFSAHLKCHFLYLSHFHDEHVNTTTIRRVGKVNENLMSDMLSQHYFL